MSHAELQMQAYGLGAAALIGLAFYACRRMQIFAIASAVIVCAFAAATYRSLREGSGADWFVTAAGLVAAAIGLAFVRAMLQRSVSLHLLETVERGGSVSFARDISERLDEMRRFGLVRFAGGRNELTILGRLIAAAAAASYLILQIDI